MKRPTPTLAKLNPPRLPKVVERTRLYRQLDHARKSHSIVWITGPPGMGKTTLVASYLRARKLKPLWYQVDQGDTDLAAFFHYLGLACQQAAPRYRQLLPHLTPEFLPGLSIFTRRFFEKLFGRLKSPKVLVFDNLQEGHSEEFFNVLATGLNEIPPGVTVMLLSRETPPSSLSPFIAKQVLTQIDEEDLRLTTTESHSLIQLHAIKQRITLSAPQRAYLETQMHGWVAGLILTLATIKTVSHLEDAIAGGPPQVVFDYLAEEVMNSLEGQAQQVLINTAILPWVTAPMAQALTGGADAEAVLHQLHQRRYFVERRQQPEVTYQYHPLFKSFLIAQGKKRLTPEELTALRVSAATLLVEQGEIEAAVSLFIAAGQWDQVALLIQQHAPSLLAKGQLQTVEGWLNALPGDMLAASPWLQFWLASCRLPVNPKEAQDQFTLVYEAFAQREDRLGRILSWCGLVDCVYAQWRSFTQFEGLLDRVTDLIETSQHDLPPNIEARWLSCVMGAMSWTRPDNQSLLRHFQRVMDLMPEVNDLYAMVSLQAQTVLYACWKGKLAEAETILAVLQGQRDQWNNAPFVEVIWYLGKSKLLNYFGNSEESIQVGEQGLNIAKREGLNFFIVELLTSQIYGALALGEKAKAQVWLHELWEVVKHLPGLGLDHYHFQAGWLAIQQGDIETAHSHVTFSLKGAQENGGLHPEALNLLAMAQVLFEQGEEQGADSHMESAKHIIDRLHFPHTEFLYDVVKAYFSQKRGRGNSGVVALQETFAFAKQHGLTNTTYWWRPNVMTLLCAKALEAGIETEYVQKIIRKNRLQPDGAVFQIEQWPWPVKIWTLDTMTIQVHDTPLAFTHKVPRKPLELLKAIMAFGGHDVSEERLIDALWPEAEGDKGRDVFLKTITRLRKILGVEGVLQHRDGKVSLDAQQCWVDAWAFEALMGQNQPDTSGGDQLAHPEKLEQALALYRQPFLVHNEASWSHAQRERLRTTYTQGVVSLSRHWVAQQQWKKAESCLERGLAIEPTTEALYQELIAGLMHQGRQTDAVQVFERCRKEFTTMLGIDPSAKTQRLLSPKSKE